MVRELTGGLYLESRASSTSIRTARKKRLTRCL
ncbi:hypothetical protein PO124_23250 [Bacillus licheniformis]|nr:hypothetical protein [Bacillus licheniformis]